MRQRIILSVVQIIMGAKIGEARSGKIGRTEKIFRVIKIE